VGTGAHPATRLPRPGSPTSDAFPNAN